MATDDTASSTEIDYGDVVATRATRAFTDPVIVHEPTKAWALDRDHEVRETVPLARLAMAADAPLDERIEFATWPEVLCYFATAAHDERCLGRRFRRAYQYTFRRYLERWSSLDPNEQPDPIGSEPELSEQLVEAIGTLRFAIKRDQDKHFVETRYDDLPITGVPKSYWLTHRQRREDPDRPDAYAYSALSEFMDDPE